MRCHFIKLSHMAFLTGVFFGGSIAGSIALAEGRADQPVMPVRLDAEKIAGKNLEPAGPLHAKTRGNPREIISVPEEASRFGTLFAGDIIVAVAEVPGPGKLRIENMLYDEFIQVQEGTLLLTPESTGKTEKFVAGDSLVLPKGFSGTWELVGERFRELIVVETKTFVEDQNAE